MFTYLFRLSDSTVPLITTIFLIAIALAVTVSPVVYNTLVERVELVLVAIIVVFRLIARS